MENLSLLPQRFNFPRLPKEITVTTDAGTGTILPGEKYKLDIEYRPSQSQCQEDSFLYMRLITGNICAREIRLAYFASVSKCPLQSDKSKIEFCCLPVTEFSEVICTLRNTSAKDQTFEIVPPPMELSGLVVNPKVQKIPPG